LIYQLLSVGTFVPPSVTTGSAETPGSGELIVSTGLGTDSGGNSIVLVAIPSVVDVAELLLSGEIICSVVEVAVEMGVSVGVFDGVDGCCDS
jgi:hypothetical protein